jgi:hypothetical protein
MVFRVFTGMPSLKPFSMGTGQEWNKVSSFGINKLVDGLMRNEKLRFF